MQICLVASAEAVHLFPSDIPFKGVFKVALTARRLRLSGSFQCTTTEINAQAETVVKTGCKGFAHYRGLCTDTQVSG